MDSARFERHLARKGITVDVADVYDSPIRGLLTESNPKILKGEKRGYLSTILHLSPSDRSGFQVCVLATAGCRAACLNHSGHGGIGLDFGYTAGDNSVQRARRRRTYWYFARRPEFMAQLETAIDKHVRKAERKGLIPCVRLNGTSDIPWETVPVGSSANIFERFPGIQFYDYTKVPGRPLDIHNYHLTFSLAESNEAHARAELARGVNVAAVFRDVPETYWDAPVVDGDDSDLRFLDPAGVVVGLKAKGDAKRDTSGFVR